MLRPRARGSLSASGIVGPAHRVRNCRDLIGGCAHICCEAGRGTRFCRSPRGGPVQPYAHHESADEHATAHSELSLQAPAPSWSTPPWGQACGVLSIHARDVRGHMPSFLCRAVSVRRRGKYGNPRIDQRGLRRARTRRSRCRRTGDASSMPGHHDPRRRLGIPSRPGNSWLPRTGGPMARASGLW